VQTVSTQTESSYWDKFGIARLTRRRLVAGAAGAVGIALSGCARGSTSGSSSRPGANPNTAGDTPRAGGTFNLAQAANPPSLDIHQTSSAFTFRAMGPVFSRLFRFKTAPDPNVARNWDLENELGVGAESPDGVTWTIKLQPQAHFHNIAPVNGHAVEAEDVKATFTRALAATSPNRGSLDFLDASQIQTPASDTVVFKLHYPYAPFPRLLASPTTSFILPREALVGSYDPARQVIGSGPFVFDSYQPDVAFTVKKNPTYFEKDRPYVDTVRCVIVADPNTQIAQFSAGNLDMLSQLGLHDVEAVKRSVPNATVIQSTTSSDLKINMLLGDPSSPWQDIRLRRALSLGIDRDVLTKLLWDGQAINGFWVAPYFTKWALKLGQLSADSAQWHKYDPARAKQLLAESGHADIELKIPDAPGTPGGAIYNKSLEQLPPMLQAAGFKTQLVPSDYQKDFMAGGKGYYYGYFKPDMVVPWFTSVQADPDLYLYNYFDSKSTTTMQRVSDSTIDAMIDKSRTILNDDQRGQIYLDAQKYVADKMYGVSFLPVGYTYQVVQPRIRNFSYAVLNGWGTEVDQKLWITG
jgi:peptide/nickel transport system substrate-binding protein